MSNETTGDPMENEWNEWIFNELKSTIVANYFNFFEDPIQTILLKQRSFIASKSGKVSKTLENKTRYELFCLPYLTSLTKKKLNKFYVVKNF